MVAGKGMKMDIVLPHDENLRCLRQAEIFQRLTEEDLEPLSELARLQRYAQGQLISCRADDERGIFVIAHGGVRLYLVSCGGRELELFRRRTGDVFELGGLDPSVPDAMLAEALIDDTFIYVIPWPWFLTFVSSSPDAASSLAILMLRRCAEERALLQELAFYPIAARLARKLVELARGNGLHAVGETHEVLAAMIGARREDVTKALRHLRDEGLVSFRYHGRQGILVLDLERLASYGERAA
jgi:CRP/FNR family transcriptional regulator, cyclic AMP receptor protein